MTSTMMRSLATEQGVLNAAIRVLLNFERVERGDGPQASRRKRPWRIRVPHPPGGGAISCRGPGSGVPSRRMVTTMPGPESTTWGREITGIDVGVVTAGGLL
jgi:hypothetical protein